MPAHAGASTLIPSGMEGGVNSKRLRKNGIAVSAQLSDIVPESAIDIRLEHDKRLYLIYPQALNYVNIVQLAQRIGKTPFSPQSLYDLRNKLQSLWRLPMPEALKWRADHEVMHEKFREAAAA